MKTAVTLIIVCITVCLIVVLVFGFTIHRNDLAEVSTVVTLFPPKLNIMSSSLKPSLSNVRWRKPMPNIKPLWKRPGWTL